MHSDLQRIDLETVRGIEGQCPRYSLRDAQAVSDRLQTGQLFSDFSASEREAIRREVWNVDCLIPSLYTFFEDIKYLQPCAESMRHLVKPSRSHRTLYKALRASFSAASSQNSPYPVEVHDGVFTPRPVPPEDRFRLGRSQLWLYAMRYTPQLARIAGRKPGLLAKARTERADEEVLSRFAVLAKALGFETTLIHHLVRQSSDRQIARAALLKARKPGQYEYDGRSFDSFLETIQDMMTAAKQRRIEPADLAFISEDTKASGHRYGHPSQEHFTQDQKLLFLDNIQKTPSSQGQEITSFFVRWSVFLAFFGDTKSRGSNDQSRLSCESRQESLTRDGEQRMGSCSVRSTTHSSGHNSDNIARETLELCVVTQQETQQELEQQQKEIREQRRSKQEQALDVEERASPRKRAKHRAIRFISNEEGVWKTVYCAANKNNQASEVETAARTFMENQLRPYSLTMTPLLPEDCFEAAVSSGRNLLLLISEADVNITREFAESVSQIRLDGE